MPPRPKKPSEKKTNRLLEAIDFLSCVTKEEGTPYETHILLSNKTAIAYNDIVSAGCLIDEEIYAAPHNQTLLKALSKCGHDPYTLVIDGQRIVLKAGKFKASVPCIDPTLLDKRWPDNPCAPLQDSFKDALKCMDLIKPETNAQKVHLLSFLLNGGSVITTDGKILIEYWHGQDLPTIAIPKIIIEPILKSTKKLSSLGMSNNSVTFYFEDNSWVKSQLYVDEWPLSNTNDILNRDCNATPIPVDLYKALSAVGSFSDSGNVFFKRDLLCSHHTTEAGATHDVTGLSEGPIFSCKYLSMIKDYIQLADFKVPANGYANGYMCYFFGKNVRGVIAGHG